LKKKHVLVVDDDKSLLNSLAEILRFEGYEVEIAEGGQEALEKSKRRFYDLALLDAGLPDMEGTELLRRLNDTSPSTVKIMTTDHPSIASVTDALNLGADAYLIKPLGLRTLVKTIEEKLKASAQRAPRGVIEKVVG